MRTIRTAAISAFVLVLTAAPATAALCGRPLSNGPLPTASDALYILRTSVGSVLCTLSACDPNSDCAITATDALRALRAAVGQSVSLACNSLCATEALCGDAAAATCNGICSPGFACTADTADLTSPDQRITICHTGELGPQTYTVGPARLSEHINHGDPLGECAPTAGTSSLDDIPAAMTGVDGNDYASEPVEHPALTADTQAGVGVCSCQPLFVTFPSTTTTFDPSATTTTTSTSTTNTLPDPPVGDEDNDGLFDEADPCPLDVRNRCFGPLAVDTLSGVPIRINADATLNHECSGLRVDCAGDTWYPDFGYSSPFTGHECDLETDDCTIKNIIPLFGCRNAATEDILQCEHFDRVPLPELAYHFNVPDGRYVVNMFFANTWKTTRIAGKRIFDISVGGELVYPAFDVVAMAGGSRTALLRSAVTTVSGGTGLTIDFGHIVENPTIKAIEVFAESP